MKVELAEQLFSTAQVREIDRVAIEQADISGIELMRQAGEAVFQQIKKHWPRNKSIRIFCGAGNNGGDGYIIGALAIEAGMNVEVVALQKPKKLKGDAQLAFQQYEALKGETQTFKKIKKNAKALVVDAIFGTGLSRPPEGEYAEAIALINQGSAPVVAVDIPSGLCADSGCVLGAAVKADLSVTFIAHKQGLFTGEAAEYSGLIHFAPLQVPQSIIEKFQPTATLLSQIQPLPPRHRAAHKGHCGHVLLIGGDSGYLGAICLAAEAALKSGAGLVSVATRAEHSHFVTLRQPEIMSHGVERVHDLSALIDKANAIVIGPGLGQSRWSQMMMNAVMATDKPCVIDADGLNLLAKKPQQKANWILTPHPGEAARLLDSATADINADRYQAAAQLQQQYGGVCILKGAGTLITNQAETKVNTTGNPGMASGGMGDVLAGLSGGLLAQGLDSWTAAQTAVHLHGKAADMAAESGERGLIASDLIAHFKTLLNS